METADEEAALQLLELLSGLGTPESATAVVAGLRSPHADVRLQTLGKLTGDNGGPELQALLSDPSPRVRCEALRMISKLRMRSVGPALVRRIQQESFREMASDERKTWLTCLHALNPVRAEEIAVAMLGNAPMIRDEKNDASRICERHRRSS